MPYKFKSRATADLIMLDATARRLLAIMGKELDSPGILTPEQLPAAIAALEQAVQDDEARRAACAQAEDAADAQDDAEDEAQASPRDPVSLRQRTAPLIEMLRRSAAEGRDVSW